MFEGSSILVTGGTGSFGKKFIRTVLEQYPDVRRVICFSRDELKQFEMSRLPEFQDKRLRFFLGDVRDRDRLMLAFDGVDHVVHAAALKQVTTCEYNPFEAIKTNVIGAQNIIDACMARNIKRVVALSTDKAAAPINLYGATKLCSDKLFVAANNFKGERDVRLSVVRYGNVMGSRGSVIPLFLKMRQSGRLTITHPEMTRFNITLEDAARRVLYALEHAAGGEVFVPKLPSYRVTTLAEAIAPDCRQEVIGIRPGEKLHEEMITDSDSFNTVEFDDHYVIMPSAPSWNVDAYIETRAGRRCTPGFRYNSGTNNDWLSADQIRTLIRDHIEPGFVAHQNTASVEPLPC